MTTVLTEPTNGKFDRDDLVLREFRGLETWILQRIVNNYIPSFWERLWARRNGRGAFCIENGRKHSYTFNPKYVPTTAEAQAAREWLDKREAVARRKTAIIKRKTAEKLRQEKLKALEKKEIGLSLNGRNLEGNPRLIYNDFGYNVEIVFHDAQNGDRGLYMFPREVDKEKAEKAIQRVSLSGKSINRVYFITEPSAQNPGFNIEYIVGEDKEKAHQTNGLEGRGLRLYRFPLMVIEEQAREVYDPIKEKKTVA